MKHPFRTLLWLAAFCALLLLAPALPQSATPMRQVFVANQTVVVGSGATQVRHLTTNDEGSCCGDLTEHAPWPTAGSFEKLTFKVDVAPGSGKSWAITMRKADANTALTCTIADLNTSCTDSTHTVSVNANDLVSLNIAPASTPATVAKMTHSVEFVSTNTGEQGYILGNDQVSTGPLFAPLFSGAGGGGRWRSTVATGTNPAAISGTITALYAYSGTDQADGTCVSTYSIYKNGSIEASSSLAWAEADSAVNAKSATGLSIAISPGDTFAVGRADTGSSCAAANMSFGARVVATTNGESMSCGFAIGNMGSTENFTWLMTTPRNDGWATPEINRTQVTATGMTDFTLNKFYLRIATAPGAGKTRTLTVRENSATPAGAPTITISDAATTGNDTTSAGITYDAGDTLSLDKTTTGTPTDTGDNGWCLKQTDITLAPAGGFNALRTWPWLEARRRIPQPPEGIHRTH